MPVSQLQDKLNQGHLCVCVCVCVCADPHKSVNSSCSKYIFH